VFDIGGFVELMIVITVASVVIVPALIIGVFIWTVRRSVPRAEDPAVRELKARYARGEIEPAEFEVRLRSLTQER
jgi:uncharacterized membrane protein